MNIIRQMWGSPGGSLWEGFHVVNLLFQGSAAQLQEHASAAVPTAAMSGGSRQQWRSIGDRQCKEPSGVLQEKVNLYGDRERQKQICDYGTPNPAWPSSSRENKIPWLCCNRTQGQWTKHEIITEKIEAADLLSWGSEFFPLTPGPYFGTSGHGSSYFTRSTPSFLFVTIRVSGLPFSSGGSE